MTQSRRRAIMVSAAWGLRGYPVAQVARLLGVSERSVERYWRLAMSDSSAAAIPEFPALELTPKELETIAHNIAGWAPDAQTAVELAACLQIPVSAFADARAAIRQQQYAAPAAEVFTVLHKVARGYSSEGFGWTACGRVMSPDGLWQFVEPADGDPVCPACLGRSNGHVQEALA